MNKKTRVNAQNLKFFKIFCILLFCFIFLISQSPIINTKASDDQVEINLTVSLGPNSATLNWDDVYPDFWYIPETAYGDDGEFLPLVDIPIRENQFKHVNRWKHDYYRIRVVDESFNEIAISKKVRVKKGSTDIFEHYHDVTEDGDCRCLQMLCLQTDTDHLFHCYLEEDHFEKYRTSPPISENKKLKWIESFGHKLRHAPIKKNGRVFIEPRDIVDAIHHASWDWDAENQKLTMLIPRTKYGYDYSIKNEDDFKPYHFKKVELEIGEHVALIDGQPLGMDHTNTGVVPFITKDDDGIEHIMVPLRFMAEVTDAKEVLWLPKYNIPMITYEINDCGCALPNRNTNDTCKYDNWEIEISNTSIGTVEGDLDYFSTDGKEPKKTAKSSTTFSLDFSVVNNNKCPITYIIETPDIWIDARYLDTMDPNKLDPITLQPGEKSEPINITSGIYDYPDAIIRLIKITLVYEEGEYVEKENTIKTVTIKTDKCCLETQFEFRVDFPDNHPGCISSGEAIKGKLRLGIDCYEPIFIKLEPMSSITNHNFPTDIFELRSGRNEGIEIPFEFTAPKKAEEDLIFLKIVQLDKDKNLIDDCEWDFWLEYCEE